MYIYILGKDVVVGLICERWTHQNAISDGTAKMELRRYTLKKNLQWQKAVNMGSPEASMVISPQMHFPGATEGSQSQKSTVKRDEWIDGHWRTGLDSAG